MKICVFSSQSINKLMKSFPMPPTLWYKYPFILSTATEMCETRSDSAMLEGVALKGTGTLEVNRA